MATIEGFRVQNFRALRDVTLGKLSAQQEGSPLTPFTVVIGKNGVGKSSLFYALNMAKVQSGLAMRRLTTNRRKAIPAVRSS